MLTTILNRNLLKYSAGHAITCPSCGKIADYRRWVIWESPAGQHGANCADCWRKGLAKMHDDKPHAYLLSIGWQVNTLVDFDKVPRKPAQIPQKAGKALNTYLRRTIHNAHKASGNCTKTDRLFPRTFHPDWQVLETVQDDGTIDIGFNWESKDLSTRALTDSYVRHYCELNHLKVA